MSNIKPLLESFQKKMKTIIIHFYLFFIYFIILAPCLLVNCKVYNRYDFPQDFIFGASTSSYQVEGAALEDGRKASIFDTFAVRYGSFGDAYGEVAADQYHKYKEDVQLMVDTGLDAYRFSISWSRIIPDGRGDINPKGIQYYNNLINELIAHGIQPHATLMHLDTPQALEDEYGGFLSERIVEDFTAYADVCFREFGDRVSYWTTINEANILVLGGYDQGDSPPGRCSYPFGHRHCPQGNSSVEPYIVAHNVLLAHASAARLYREKYQDKSGSIGFSLYMFHFIPLTNSTEDEIAVHRAYSFFVGLLMDPLMYGDYPEIVKTTAKNRIRIFTKHESELVKGSFDFIGINFYTVIQIKNTELKPGLRDYVADMATQWLLSNNQSFDPRAPQDLPILPWSLQGVLEYFQYVYGNPPIYIHENGQMTDHNTSVHDPSRVKFLQAYIGGVLDAIRNGSNTKAYFVWSFLDLFELLYAYRKSYGLYYVDFNDPDRCRYPKLSQNWYSGFLNGKNVTIEDEAENMLSILGSGQNMYNEYSS